jgi:DNA-3-methyladenine glycosylase
MTPIESKPLGRSFFGRPADVVAEELLGCYFVRMSDDGTRDDGTTAGWIVETEAYLPNNDPASHAARGLTRSNKSMFGPPGLCYVYPIHAKHCVNVSTDDEGVGSAVLLRAIEPHGGFELMQQRRGAVPELDWCRGPARLCQAFAIDRQQDGCDMTCSQELWIAPGLKPRRVSRSPRIGVTSAEDAELRFFVDGNRFVSGLRRNHSTRPVERLADDVL